MCVVLHSLSAKWVMGNYRKNKELWNWIYKMLSYGCKNSDKSKSVTKKNWVALHLAQYLLFKLPFFYRKINRELPWGAPKASTAEKSCPQRFCGAAVHFQKVQRMVKVFKNISEWWEQLLLKADIAWWKSRRVWRFPDAWSLVALTATEPRGGCKKIYLLPTLLITVSDGPATDQRHTTHASTRALRANHRWL